MTDERIRTVRRLLVAATAAICLAAFGSPHATAADGKDAPAKKANVFVYPEKLTAKDKLVDGPAGAATEIPIKGETTLIWIDLNPDARFAHATEYVLISAEGTRVVKGGWWPVLNGKPLFRDEKAYQVEFPRKHTGK